MSDSETTPPADEKSSRKNRRADAIAPATVKESFTAIRHLPHCPRKRSVVLFIAVLVATSLCITASAELVGRFVDIVTHGASALTVAVIISLMGLLMLIEAVLNVLARYLVSAGILVIVTDLRRGIVNSVMRSPIPAVAELGTGNIITRMSSDLSRTKTFLTWRGSQVALTGILLPIALFSLLSIHWVYGVILLGVMVIVIAPLKKLTTSVPILSNIRSSTEARRNNVLLDTINSLETLNTFSLGRWARKRMERSSWATVQASADVVPAFNTMLAIGYLATGILLIATMGLSVPILSAGWVSIGQATAAVLMVVRLEQYLFTILFSSAELQEASTAIGRAVSILDLDQDDLSRLEAPRQLPHGRFDIEITHLDFSYDDSAPVLTDINLTIEAGSTVALVGTTGAGKSTLATLIAGLNYPTAGQIHIGGINTAEVKNSWVAEHVTLMTQEVHLFSGTVRNDLLLANPSATDDDLIGALSTVELIPDSPLWQRWLPQGLDTLVGAGHKEVSPEVGQQLAMARILLRQPPVLIMDEATSEAGSEHAGALEDAARAVTKNRTAVVVAHRLDQAKQADRIIVMEEGTIVEDGPHDQLIATGGRYARAFAQWSGH